MFRPPPDLTTASQRKIYDQAMSVIATADEASADCVRKAVWNRWEKGEIGSATASHLLTELSLKLSGGPGLTRILPDGSQESMRL